jgi:peptidoglycan-associated lipoprotein
MKKFVLAGLVSTLLVACGTSVPLNDVPVEDATAKAAGADAGAAGSGVQGGGVAPVDLGRGVDQAPAPADSRLVYFDYDSFVIKPEFQAVIAAHARFLRAHPAR